MRAILTIALLAAASWRAAVDWNATIGAGYAYRFDTLGGAISGRWPASYGRLVESLQASGVPGAWNPVGALVMSMPVALLLAAIAGTIWITRDRRRAR
jgi:hypothetical protein